jgi:hypothetical protein
MFCLPRAVAGSADVKSILKQPIPPDSDQSVCFEGYWVPLGKLEPNVDAKVKHIQIYLYVLGQIFVY